MSAHVANPVIEKQAFRNESPGWLGVVRIGPKGEDRGASVAPGEIVWLSEAEQILTANAPRRPEDNPFIEQELTFGVDEDGKPVVRRVTPLVPVDEMRYVPAGDRPIPAQGMATPPAVDQSPEPSEDAPDEATVAREREVVEANAAGQDPAPQVQAPARAAAAVEAANRAKVAAQPTPPQDVTPPEAAAETASDEPPTEETAAAAVPEEHGETGAAVEPSQEAAPGEYAAKEEVGTPTAPAPYVPPQED